MCENENHCSGQPAVPAVNGHKDEAKEPSGERRGYSGIINRPSVKVRQVLGVSVPPPRAFVLTQSDAGDGLPLRVSRFWRGGVASRLLGAASRLSSYCARACALRRVCRCVCMPPRGEVSCEQQQQCLVSRPASPSCCSCDVRRPCFCLLRVCSAGRETELSRSGQVRSDRSSVRDWLRWLKLRLVV